MIYVQALTLHSVLSWYDTMYAILPLVVVILTVISFVLLSRRRNDDGSPIVLLHCGIWSTVVGLILFLVSAGIFSQRFETAVEHNIAENIAIEHVVVENVRFEDDGYYVDTKLTVPKYQSLTYVSRDGVPRNVQHSLDRGSIAASYSLPDEHNNATQENVIIQMSFKYHDTYDIMVPVQERSSYPVYVLPSSSLSQYFQDIP